MNSSELLTIEPPELQFTFELKKQISCSLKLSNQTNNYVAFKVKTTNPKNYCVKPNFGVVFPWSTCNVLVIMQAQKEVPFDMQCKDRFVIQSFVLSPATTVEDVTSEMFSKEAGRHVEEYILRVVYVKPPVSPSLNGEGAEEDSSTLASLSDYGFLRHQIAKNPCELLNIEPRELQFPFELKKQISCSLKLSNETDNYVAFKVKTTKPKKYCVKPNTGVMLPWSTCNVLVTMQAHRMIPSDMQCNDKFLIQSVGVSPGATKKDFTPETFNKKVGHYVEECELRAVYVKPPRPPSPVREGSSPKADASGLKKFNKEAGHYVEECKFGAVYVKPPQPPSPVGEGSSPKANASGLQKVVGFLWAFVSKLTGEKISAVHKYKRL